MRRKRSIEAAILVAAASWGMQADAGSWPQFRGPNGSGRPDVDRPLPAEIGPETNVVWKADLPPGHSSPVVVGDRIYVTADRDKHLLTIALDRATGQVVWERDSGNTQLEEIHRIGSHAQASPVADENCVVAFFGSYGLFCYERTGKLRWQIPMGPFKNNYGAASSPIFVGNLVVLNQDHDADSFLIAVDKSSGKEVWKTDRSEFPRGFATPIVWKHAGRDDIVVPGALRVVGYDPQDGREVWTAGGFSRICNMTPVVGDDGSLLVTEWAPGGDETDHIVAEPWNQFLLYDKDKNTTIERVEIPPGQVGSRFDQIDRDKDGHITLGEYTWMEKIFNSAKNAVKSIRPGPTGDATETHVAWEYNKLLPYVPSPIAYDGRLFMVKNAGILTCLDARTGQQIKQQRLRHTRDYYSSPVIGDGKLYLIDQQGGVTVTTADAEAKTLSATSLGELVFATPAIVDGRLYVRTRGRLYCFGDSEASGK